MELFSFVVEPVLRVPSALRTDAIGNQCEGRGMCLSDQCCENKTALVTKAQPHAD